MKGDSFAVAHDNWLRYVYVRDNGHLDFLKKSDKCENFFLGLQWDEEDMARLRAVRRPAITINKIISTCMTLFGEQIYNRAEVLYRPRPSGNTQTAEALQNVYRTITDANQMAWVRSDMFADGVIKSRGFLDCRISFDDNMRGEVVIRKENARNVLIDPDADDYDPDKWGDVYTSKWLSQHDIELLYGKDVAKEVGDKSGSSFLWGYDSLERKRERFQGMTEMAVQTYGAMLDEDRHVRSARLLDRQSWETASIDHFVDPVAGDTRPVPPTWDRNRIAAVAERYGLLVMPKLTRRIRWTQTIDDLVVHNEISPYRHFTIIPFFPILRNGRAVGLVENLLGPQELLNKSTSQELHVVNTTANSGWKVKAGSLQNMSTEELEERGATTGLVLELTDVGDADKIQPNPVPTGLDRLSFKAEEHIKGISNVSDSMQGFDREDVAAKAIVAKTNRSGINFAKVMDNLERSDWILARNVLDLVQAFYTEPRVLRVMGGGLEQEVEEIRVNEVNPETGEVVNDLTLGEYSVVVTSAPYRAAMEETQFEQAMSLREAGVRVPDSILIENSRLQRKAEILKAIQAENDNPVVRKQQELALRKEEAEIMEMETQAMLNRASATAKIAQAEKDGLAPEEFERWKLERELAFKAEQAEKDRMLKERLARQEAFGRRVDNAMAETPTTIQ